ncbi:hypothetical protein [Collimonas fungivorans]|uniref:hypothetical protein n=1 Tax=Collimonas fungivorans TaxID=158899 RepID=UPI001EE652DF|nr:hypothetical protein [Collimonas fungivorans]
MNGIEHARPSKTNIATLVSIRFNFSQLHLPWHLPPDDRKWLATISGLVPLKHSAHFSIEKMAEYIPILLCS